VQRTVTRAGLRGTLAALATLILLPLLAPSAQAQDAYRYWSYWWGTDGTWAYAQTGPADRVVKDGDVEGWLFLVSAEAEPTQQPGAAPDFDTICADEQPTAGSVRVGVVIDYGTPDVTPEGSAIPEGEKPAVSCVTVPEGSTGDAALAAAAEVRNEQGSTCAINGYPAAGCFEVVPATAPTPISAVDADAPAEDSGSGTPWLWLAAGALAVIAAVVAVLAMRNRKTPSA